MTRTREFNALELMLMQQSTTRQERVRALEDEREKLMAVFHAADQLVAHIGCHGEINSKHSLVLDLLEALNAKDPK